MNHFITYAAIFFATAQLTFLLNLVHSFLHGASALPAPGNPPRSNGTLP